MAKLILDFGGDDSEATVSGFDKNTVAALNDLEGGTIVILDNRRGAAVNSVIAFDPKPEPEPEVKPKKSSKKDTKK